MDMKKAIITGGKGFIGSNLMEEIKDRYEVIQIEEEFLNFSNWEEKILDIFSKEIEVVFHVGACSNTLEQDVNYMMLLNYEFTKRLSDICFKYRVPLVYSSSAANYGTNGKYPSNLYGWSKYSSEDYVISKGGIALRYFNVYGPGEENKGKMASVAYQMNTAHQKGEEIKLFPGNPRRDFVYVRDIISANLYALEDYEILKGKYYEVGSGESRSFEDVLNILNIPFNYHPEKSIPPGYQFFTQSDRKKWMPGWKPQWNLERGLSDYFNLDI
jgi:ADP-L-glycero-D-manno-heptose 6-epimerase